MKIKVKHLRLLIKILIAMGAAILIGVVAFLLLQLVGKSRLYNSSNKSVPQMALSSLNENSEEDSMGQNAEGMTSGYVWQEGDIRYQGTVYRYNEDILTFLFMGIDKNKEVEVIQKGINGGQSDAMFLLVLNSHTREIAIIGIPRDTMTEIDVYNNNGDYIGVAMAQIALQHGYGDGAAISCQRSVNAVSNLFYGLSINGYCSINMEAIPELNDAIGGVEVQVLEDIISTTMKAGDTVLLKGEKAYAYLHNRDITSFGSAGRRLDRQKQYLNAYIAKAMEEVKKDITLPITLYTTLSKYMVTDVTIDEVSYLATRVADYHFDSSNMYSLAGETVMGEKFEEYYVDEEALYELILEVFYEAVNTEQKP